MRLIRPQTTSSTSWVARTLPTMLLLVGSTSLIVRAIDLDVTDKESIKDAAGTVSYELMTWYNANETGVGVPGNLPKPYYWWEAGALMMSMISYWYYTGDSTYNKQVETGMLHQTGDTNDFMPDNQTKTEGNDDQAFWGFAALEAAELKFPNPPKDGPQWLELAQATFNTQVPRWDKATCGGGLRWQIYPFNAGYNYKNTISQGGFFNMGSRLARYTGNKTYAEEAEKAWDWTVKTNLLGVENFHVYDGADVLKQCKEANHLQWSSNAGVFLHGAANMWNFTEDNKWKERIDGLVKGLDFFFPDNGNILSEVACEPRGNCNYDQRSFKAYLARWMAATTQLAPWTGPKLWPKIKASAEAAAQQCSGTATPTDGKLGMGKKGSICGMKWIDKAKWDGSHGPGEAMAAMNIISANLINPELYPGGKGMPKPPLTRKTGGISKGDPAAGGDHDTPTTLKPITTADRAGAGIITFILAVTILGGAVWLAW